jgi:carbonic anhydrase/acetyltransferase-like protein (isoleucine patch superfamily)
MKILNYKEFRPEFDDSNFIAEGVILIGRAKLHNKANIWFNSVIRADVNEIIIGENTNVQDLSMLHVTEKQALVICENVTIGHSVTLHACTINKNSLIGMGATILDGVIINKYSIVAAGSVVPPNKVYPKNSMIMGSPAKVVRELNEKEIEMLNNHYKSYLKYSEEFKKN